MSAAASPRVLVVGHGSIGARHARLLGERGCETAVVTRQPAGALPAYEGIGAALADWRPSYVVVANATDGHLGALATLGEAGYAGTVLVEKPLFAAPAPLPANRFAAAFVGYNLRFHPVVRALRQALVDERVLSVQAYAGQYLPSWRAGDYRASYSASAARGGGALRDLSHELDYLCWILGPWRAVAAVGGRTSSLAIDSDDAFTLLVDTARCHQVAVQVNFLDRPGRRRIVVNTDRHTIEADLAGATLAVDGVSRAYPTERDDSYRAMHAAIIDRGGDGACTVGEAGETLELITAAERAARERAWIVR